MRKFQPCLLCLFCFLLSSCCFCRDEISPLQRDRVCEELKQQIVLNSTRNAPDDFGKMPNTTAYLYKLYDENNCAEKLERGY